MKKLNIKNVSIINKDYEDAFQELENYIEKKVGLYFVDGPHDYRSQFMCLQLVKPYLSENALIVIDDCNYQHVRQANYDFLTTNPSFKLIFEAYTRCHPDNMTNNERKEAIEGWWNGINIIIQDSSDKIVPMFPPTTRNRKLYEDEHFIHPARFLSFHRKQ